MIINLPKNLERETTHRYGPNTFKLHRYCGGPLLKMLRSMHESCERCALEWDALEGGGSTISCRMLLTHRRICRLPVPRAGQVLGLVGTNGIGKSTALKVLAGKLKPNLGRFDSVRERACLPLQLGLGSSRGQMNRRCEGSKYMAGGRGFCS
jgi:ATP-binding cassette subfamily E protein 1